MAFAAQAADGIGDRAAQNTFLREIIQKGKGRGKTFALTGVVILPAAMVAVGFQLFAPHQNFRQLMRPRADPFELFRVVVVEHDPPHPGGPGQPQFPDTGSDGRQVFLQPPGKAQPHVDMVFDLGVEGQALRRQGRLVYLDKGPGFPPVRRFRKFGPPFPRAGGNVL